MHKSLVAAVGAAGVAMTALVVPALCYRRRSCRRRSGRRYHRQRNCQQPAATTAWLLSTTAWLLSALTSARCLWAAASSRRLRPAASRSLSASGLRAFGARMSLGTPQGLGRRLRLSMAADSGLSLNEQCRL
jgi:hypothetical protein